jgi:hypothetical protein
MPLTITHAKSNTIADYTGTVTAYNSSGGTATVAATDLVRPVDWNSAHQYTLSVAGSELYAMSQYEPFPQPNTNSTLSAPGIGTWYLDPFRIEGKLSNGIIYMPVIGGVSTNAFQDGAVWSAASTGSNTRYFTFLNNLAIYKRGAGASSTRLESVWSDRASWLVTWERRVTSGATNAFTISNYLTVSVPLNMNSTGGLTWSSNSASGTVGVAASTGASTLASSLITGPMRFLTGSRMEMIPFATTLGAGDYVLGHMFSSSTSVTGTNYTAGTVITTQSRLGLLENAMGAFKRIGNSTTNATSCPQLFHGYLATTTISASSAIATADVRSTTGRAYWNFAETTH